MSQATRPNDRHIIWSNQNLDVDDWREDYKEFLEANELDDDPNDEQALYEWMVETNGDYLYDERANLNIQLSQPIIVIGDIGRWNGRVMGYKEIPSGNIRDCLYADTDYTEWYVDKYGDLRADAAHHDGTNHYLYRVFKEGVSETQIVPFPVSWTVKMKKKQKETQDILSYHTQAAGCSDKARAKASGGRQPIEECGRTGL